MPRKPSPSGRTHTQPSLDAYVSGHVRHLSWNPEPALSRPNAAWHSGDTGWMWGGPGEAWPSSLPSACRPPEPSLPGFMLGWATCQDKRTPAESQPRPAAPPLPASRGECLWLNRGSERTWRWVFKDLGHKKRQRTGRRLRPFPRATPSPAPRAPRSPRRFPPPG